MFLRVVCLSTDKAVYPVNAMGVSKAMMEKMFVAKSRNSKNTIITGTTLWKRNGLKRLCNSAVY
jgi:FlaA1/EpsC-like NDP-sugar epimerase